MTTTFDPIVGVHIGDTASLTKKISDSDVLTFAEISGDRNPVHLDENYAASTPFGKRIAHGTLVGALISAVLGQILPGPGSIYLNQTYSFKAPVYIGDEITAKVEVVKYRQDKRITTLKTVVFNHDGTLVIEGEAVVIAPEI
jgi:acyl dehydratase